MGTVGDPTGHIVPYFQGEFYIRLDRKINSRSFLTNSFKVYRENVLPRSLGWDLKQSCYIAFMEAVRGYKADKDLKFTAYLSYPFRNAVNNLIGVRTKTKQNEPLNNCTSLETPVSDDENLTLADTLIDETAVNAVDAVELEDEYRILHEVVNSLKPPLNHIVNAYYFEDKTYKQIGEEMGMSGSAVSSYSAKAKRCLRASPILKELYMESRHHEELNSWQNVQTRPDFHLYIRDIEENYKSYRQRRI